MRRWPVGTILKTLFALAVVVGVGSYFAKILLDPKLNAESFTLRWEWLFFAGLLYLTAHTIWGTFWWQLLRSQGANVRWRQGVGAYFISQLGKYVPGKIWVIVMRVSLLGGNIPRRVVIVTGIYETLTSMAAGSTLGAALFPYLTGGQSVLQGGTLALGGIAAVPFLAALVNNLAARLAKKRHDPDAPSIPAPPLWLLALGLLQASVGWCLLAVSLRCVLMGVVPRPPDWTSSCFVQDLAVTTIMYVAGFVVIFAPGGVGPRELILQQALVPVLRSTSGDAAGGLAAIVAIVIRVVWTVAELLMIGLLGWRKGVSRDRAD